MLRRNNWHIPKQSVSCLKLLRATSDWRTPHKSVRATQSQGQADVFRWRPRLRTSAHPISDNRLGLYTTHTNRSQPKCNSTSTIVSLFVRI